MNIPENYIIPSLTVLNTDVHFKEVFPRTMQLATSPKPGKMSLFQAKNFEGGYDVQIYSNEFGDIIYKDCYSVISKDDKKAVFFHQFSTSTDLDADESIEQLMRNFNRMKSILSFMHSLTNAQCADAIKAQMKNK